MSSSDDSWSLYPYDPNKPGPIAFAIIISALGVCHAYQSFFHYKWRRFGFMMVWASVVWTAGFVTRAISVYNTQNVDIFICQFVLILVGPPLYAASEYFILGRLLAYLPYHTPLHPGRVLSTFFLLSTVVEALTANGAANSSGSGREPGQRSAGLACLKAALILQAVVEAGFCSLVALLHHRCKKAGHLPHNVRVVTTVLYTTSLMMLMRCIVRAVEGFEAAACDPDAPGYNGYCGPVQRNEWFLWVFEVANITVFVAALALFPPGKYLPKDHRRYLDPLDGRTERMGPGFGKADKRPLIITIIDPFNLFGILTGKGLVVDKFWEKEQPICDGSFADKRTSKGVDLRNV